MQISHSQNLGWVFVALFTFAVHLSLCGQGALTTPGTPAPTMKTLDQIEPRIDVATLPGDANSHVVITMPSRITWARTSQ